MEDIWIDLELGKKLKEAGFQQDTIYKWLNISYGNLGEPQFDIVRYDPGTEYGSYIECAAPTAEEIIKELPSYITIDNEKYTLVISKHDGDYYVRYEFLKSMNRNNLCKWYKTKSQSDIKLCNALAKMWLYIDNEEIIDVYN